jgi:hypothetical protein
MGTAAPFVRGRENRVYGSRRLVVGRRARRIGIYIWTRTRPGVVSKFGGNVPAGMRFRQRAGRWHGAAAPPEKATATVGFGAWVGTGGLCDGSTLVIRGEEGRRPGVCPGVCNNNVQVPLYYCILLCYVATLLSGRVPNNSPNARGPRTSKDKVSNPKCAAAGDWRFCHR